MIWWASMEQRPTWWTCLARFPYRWRRVFGVKLVLIYFVEDTTMLSSYFLLLSMLSALDKNGRLCFDSNGQNFVHTSKWTCHTWWASLQDLHFSKVAGGYLQLQQGYGANSRGIHKIWQGSNFYQPIKQASINYGRSKLGLCPYVKVCPDFLQNHLSLYSAYIEAATLVNLKRRKREKVLETWEWTGCPQDLALDIQSYQSRCFEEQQRQQQQRGSRAADCFDGRKKRHSLGFWPGHRKTYFCVESNPKL